MVTNGKNNKEYMELVKYCFLYNLNKYVELTGQSQITLIDNDILEMSDIVPHEFLPNKTSDCATLIGDEYVSTNRSNNKLIEELKRDGVKIIDEVLDALKANNKLNYRKSIMFIKYERDEFDEINIEFEEYDDTLILHKIVDTEHCATLSEIETLRKCEKQTIEEMFPTLKDSDKKLIFENKDKFIKNNHLAEEFNNKLFEILKRDHNIDIDDYTDCYEIVDINIAYTHDKIKNKTYKDIQKELTKAFAKKVRDCNRKAFLDFDLFASDFEEYGHYDDFAL